MPFFAAFLALLITSASAAPVKFNIPAKPAKDGIDLFIKQSGVRVAYVEADLTGVSTNSVMGDYEPLAGLGVLLQNTGFVASERKAGWYSVARATQKPGTVEGAVRNSQSGKPVAGARVAVAGTRAFALTDSHGGFILEEVPAGTQALNISAEGMQNTRVTDVTVRPGHRHTLSAITIPPQVPGVVQMDDYIVSAKKNEGVIELDPYEVQDRKVKPFSDSNVDIPRTINDPQPYYIFNSEAIETSGAVNVEDFLKTRLTMNTSSGTADQIAAGFGGSAIAHQNAVNLNGFGGGNTGNRTLILVNGQRRVSGDQLVGTIITQLEGQPDLSGIPLSSIDRIEVLPSSASAIYGSTAIGGVINVILKRNYSGGELRATYQNTFDSDAPIRRVDMSYGFSIRGKTHVMLNASYSDAEPLRLADRAGYVQAAINRINASDPTYLMGAIPFAGALPNITVYPGALNGYVNPTSTTLTLDDGRSLNSKFTFVPRGTSPATATATLANALLANAGSYDFNLAPSYSSTSGLYSTLGWGPPTNRSFSASIRHEFTPWLEAFADYDYSRTDSTAAQGIISSSGVSVPGNAPSNPFRQNVRISYPVLGFAPSTQVTDRHALSVGVKAQLPHEWIAQLNFTWSENVRNGFNAQTQDTTASLAVVTDPGYNPFVDTALYPVLSMDATEVYSGSHARNAETGLALRASGPLFSLPGGTPNLTLGIETAHRGSDDSVTNTINPNPAVNLTLDYIGRTRQVTSAYAEADIPLIGPRQGVPAINSLSLQFANRIDRVREPKRSGQWSYRESTGWTVFGNAKSLSTDEVATYSSNHPTIGFLYRPIADVALRASYATAFEPPSASQLLPASAIGTTPFAQSVFDPKRNQTYPMLTLGGGNPDLKPQNSKSIDLGLIYEPRSGPLRGFRFNLEYQRSRIMDLIASLSASQIVQYEDLFPGRVTRDATGMVTLVDTSSINQYYQEMEEYTASLRYATRTPFGNVEATFAGTRYTRFDKQILVNLPVADYVGFVSSGGPGKLKENATFNWQRGAWGAGWSATFYSSYAPRGAPGDPAYATATAPLITNLQGAITRQGGTRIPSQTYHQVWVRYAFPDNVDSGAGKIAGWVQRAMAGSTLQLIVKNVFDKEPPFEAFNEPYYYSRYGDMRLREYVLSLKKPF